MDRLQVPTHQCTMGRLGAVHHTSVQQIDYIIPPHQCTMDRLQFPCTSVQWTAVPQDWHKLDRLQFSKTGVQWIDCSSPRLVYNGQIAPCTHMYLWCRGGDKRGWSFRGNAAVSVAVTKAGQGKCSSVSCCYNSRSGEMQQCQLLLQQQVRGLSLIHISEPTRRA